jgi:putative Mn2+ efflux pump MntP
MLFVHNLFKEREIMDITIVLVAFALAMDSFSVSITNGLAAKFFKVGYALKIGISGLDHWIAFGHLASIGCGMIYESVRVESARALMKSTGMSYNLQETHSSPIRQPSHQ